MSLPQDVVVSVFRKIILIGRQSDDKSIDVPDPIVWPIAKALSADHAPELSGHFAGHRR